MTPETPLSRSHIDKLGDRLADEALDLETFDELQRYFDTLTTFADETFRLIEQCAASIHLLQGSSIPRVTRRRIKTLTSIREKLLRQTTTLSQMQDIVGCRIIVDRLTEQDQLSQVLMRQFNDNASMIDRRANPSNGYRAVHIIIRSGVKRFEIQIRTVAQDRWANLVERLSDMLGIVVKYGGGPEKLKEAVMLYGDSLYAYDKLIDQASHSATDGDLVAADHFLSAANTVGNKALKAITDLLRRKA
jgi:putative GTP pyrophosphokinase